MFVHDNYTSLKQAIFDVITFFPLFITMKVDSLSMSEPEPFGKVLMLHKYFMILVQDIMIIKLLEKIKLMFNSKNFLVLFALLILKLHVKALNCKESSFK